MAIRREFSPWFRHALDETGVTLGALAYPTRPHVAVEGTEISYSNLKKYLTGQSAPSLSTVLRVVKLLEGTGRMKSSVLTALMASYPDALMRVVIGLDVIGLDAYWHSRRTQPQLERQLARIAFNTRMGNRGFRAFPRPGERAKSRPARRLVNWINEIAKHHDLLAICVAYAFFCPPYGDMYSIALLEVFSQYNENREALYWEALRRYSDFNPDNQWFGGPELSQIERVFANHAMSIEDRRTLASPHFVKWTFGHALEFIESATLLEWVDKDLIRKSLGMQL